MYKKQPWIVEAEKHIGIKEIPGPQHNPIILNWIKELGGWFKDDETPWCGTFVAVCIKRSGITPPKEWYRALKWADWGTKLSKPVPGCIGVMSRSGGGHVTFIVGIDQQGRYMGMGGNQSNQVRLDPFDPSRISHFVYPTGWDIPNEPLPVLNSRGMTVSKNEA